MMKTPKAIGLVTAFGCLALFAILAPLAAAQGKQDFTLYNRTGQAITEMYVSPASQDEWGEDILGIDVLANGESTTIHFSPKERAAKWDIKLVDEDGKPHMRYAFNLLDIDEITVRSNGDGSWYWNWK